MIDYRYFILNLPYEDVEKTLQVCINKEQPQRYNLDDSKLLIVTTNDIINKYLAMNKDDSFETLFPPEQCGECANYSHVLEVTSTSQWSVPFELPTE